MNRKFSVDLNGSCRSSKLMLWFWVMGVSLLAANAQAQITGERVVRGEVNFARNGNLTTIEASHKSIINYDSFGIPGQQTVQFIQPGSYAKVLNRITGDIPSHINGTLLANGQVYIANPSGVFFGNQALINVGAIYAAAGQISNENFLNDLNLFTDLRGPVINHGTILADTVNLIGRQVVNSGSILADEGLVTMLAGNGTGMLC